MTRHVEYARNLHACACCGVGLCGSCDVDTGALLEQIFRHNVPSWPPAQAHQISYSNHSIDRPGYTRYINQTHK